MIKKIMMLILSAVFFALFILFILPMTAGIINLGNCFGAAITGILAAVFLFSKKFSAFLSSICTHRAGRIFACSTGIIFAVCVLAALVISGFMLKEMNDKPKGKTTVVVLGCQVKESGASLMLKRRLKTAQQYLSENEDIKVIVSGGKGDDEPISEADCMYDWLIANGINSERIYKEDKSKNTEENIEFSKKIIEDKGLCPDITIVTDGYHQLRADIIAKKQNIKAYNISAPTALWLVPTYWVREWFGVAYYIVRR